MGTFPPQPKRWSMEFYYPNRTNDFWFIMGLIFFGDKYALYDRGQKHFRLNEIRKLLTDKGIALSDTGYKIVRTKNNASDKFLEIIEPVDLRRLLDKMPMCTTIATTGEKAANIIAELTGTQPPKMGEMVSTPDKSLHIWRMPSTSRAYPLAIEKKCAFYQRMFRTSGIE
ncbi:MAG: uracil-DNA glycosylase family protein [Muribaculum sp.]|nr:uracil-DNA glycosylase family protein [Muribaculaceae bacterium]MCM1080970.1 uracil-DNA glycosylase family protein [Muribaculum sp.]